MSNDETPAFGHSYLDRPVVEHDDDTGVATSFDTIQGLDALDELPPIRGIDIGTADLTPHTANSTKTTKTTSTKTSPGSASRSRVTRRLTTTNHTHHAHHTRSESDTTMTTNSDIFAQMNFNEALTNTAGMTRIAQELAPIASLIMRDLITVEDDDVAKLSEINRRAYELADDLAIAFKMTTKENESLSHIHLAPAPVRLRADHAMADTKSLIEAMLVDLTCATRCALDDNTVGLTIDLMTVAMRRDQFTEAQRLIVAISKDPAKAVSYGVPARVVHCVEDDLDELKTMLDTCAGEQVRNVRVQDGKVIVDLLDERDTYAPTDVTDAYFVEVLGELTIVTEDVLKENYTWKD